MVSKKSWSIIIILQNSCCVQVGDFSIKKKLSNIAKKKSNDEREKGFIFIFIVTKNFSHDNSFPRSSNSSKLFNKSRCTEKITFFLRDVKSSKDNNFFIFRLDFILSRKFFFSSLHHRVRSMEDLCIVFRYYIRVHTSLQLV